MHKQYATEEIEKKTYNNDMLLFSTENFQQTTKTHPKRSHSHFSDFTMRRNQGFFSPKHFAQTCATSPRHFFFCGRIWDESAVREDIPAGCHLETKMALWKHSMAVYLRKAFFYSYWKGTTKKCKTHPFLCWLFGWYRVWKISPVNIRDYMFHSCHSFRSCQIH